MTGLRGLDLSSGDLCRPLGRAVLKQLLQHSFWMNPPSIGRTRAGTALDITS
jgi:hypothetical protein